MREDAALEGALETRGARVRHIFRYIFRAGQSGRELRTRTRAANSGREFRSPVHMVSSGGQHRQQMIDRGRDLRFVHTVDMQRNSRNRRRIAQAMDA